MPNRPQHITNTPYKSIYLFTEKAAKMWSDQLKWDGSQGPIQEFALGGPPLSPLEVGSPLKPAWTENEFGAL